MDSQLPTPMRASYWARAVPVHDPKRLLGLCFVVAVALIWVGASFVVQGIEAHGAHPAVLTLVANSLFALYLPIYYANLRWRRHRAAAGRASPGEIAALVPAGQLRSDAGGGVESPAGADGGLGMRLHSLDGETPSPLAPGALAAEGSHGDVRSGAAAAEKPGMPMGQLFRASLIVAPLWYVAQLTFNTSLSMTSITSNTILSSTAALFTFLFAVALLSEAFTLWKLGFILLLTVGTAMVTLADGKYGGGDAKQGVLGDLLCLFSAVIYGAYTVSIRKLLREDDETPMTAFFGFMGAVILCTVGPIILVLWLLGADLGRMSWGVLGAMVLKGLLDNVLSDYLWARAILLVGPTIATAGLALQVPLAITLDALLRSPVWLTHAGSAVLTLLGGAVVLAGFFGVNAAGEDDEKTRRLAWEQRQAALQRELDFDLEADALDALGGGDSEDASMHRQHGRPPPYRGASDEYHNGGTSDLDAYSPTDAYGSAAPFDPAAEAEAARRARAAAANGFRP